jgi:hypothetical protein
MQSQIPSPNQALTIHPQKDLLAEEIKALEFTKELAKDLNYTGIATDVDTLRPYIYNDLTRRLGPKTSAYNRRSPFSESQVRNINATKKAVKKVV